MAAKKPAPQTEITISPATLKWLCSILAGLAAGLLVWWQVWDRVDARWRREEVQVARDAKAEADLKALEAKAAAALATHSVSEQRARLWMLYVVQDFRASAETRWAEECVDKKRPADVCREAERKAAESRTRASEARTQAKDVSEERTK